jgi:hypothetical protein
LGVGFDISFNSIAEPPSLYERVVSVLSSGKSIQFWTKRGVKGGVKLDQCGGAKGSHLKGLESF